MRKTMAVFAAFALVACSKGREYESGGAVDTARDTTSGFNVNVGTTRDTLNVPIFGTEKDTIIIDKPVVKGRKPVEVKRPTVDVTRKP